MSISELHPVAVQATNTAAIVAVTTSWVGWLPPLVTVIATVLAAVWYILQILDNHRAIKFMTWLRSKF